MQHESVNRTNCPELDGDHHRFDGIAELFGHPDDMSESGRPLSATNESEQPMITLDDQRQAAIQRLNAKRQFRVHLGVFVLVNTMLIVIWAATGAGYFWPIWPIGGWGIGLVSHAFAVYSQRPITEDDIQAEMQRQGPHDTPGY